MPRAKKKQTAKISVIWTKSAIGYSRDQKATIRALGFKKMRQTVEIQDSPSMRGMIDKVKHLVTVVNDAS
ncbi:MAG: 50S ribosomal protein L30 [Bacillota bacterium]